MIDSDAPLTIARAFIDALSRGDRAAAKALLAENVTSSEPLEDETISGPEAVVADIWAYRNTFPDLLMEVTDGFAGGDRAALQLKGTGTYEPYSYGTRAKRITWRAALIIKAQAGKLVEIDFYTDWLGPVEQLGRDGVVPVLKREGER